MRSLHPWPIFPANLDPPVARSLSLQFILQQLIVSFELVAHLQQVTPQRLQGLKPSEEIAAVASELEKFLLFSLENPFAQKGGVLDKLCFYCEILLQASNIADQDIPMILEEMRNAVLKIKSKIIIWKKMPHLHPMDQICPYLLQLYSDLQTKLRFFFGALSRFLQEARSDENVLIYLIENKGHLNAYLGARAIENLLHRFFPAGLSQLRAVICEGYTRRGFAAFFAQAEPLIESLELEAPCQLPLQMR